MAMLLSAFLGIYLFAANWFQFTSGSSLIHQNYGLNGVNLKFAVYNVSLVLTIDTWSLRYI